MDTPSQWRPQDMVVKTMEDMASRPKLPLTQASGGVEEHKSRTQKEEAINCPRCNSTNTKFCYYNNYSLSQPRYFCKTCRRYWTHGGSLRNIPVGGGSRKNKRPSSSTTSSSRNIKLPDLQALPPYHHHHQNPKNQDLDLGFTIHHSNYDDFKSITEMIQAPDFSLDSGTRPEIRLLQNPNSAAGYAYVPPLMTAATGAEISTSLAFSNLPEFKLSNSLNISLDQGLGSNYEGLQASESKVLFPFEELKQDDESSKGNQNIDNNDSEEGGDDQEHGDANGGYWNGVLGGGSW